MVVWVYPMNASWYSKEYGNIRRKRTPKIDMDGSDKK
jgi:hypothetical protein